jgi:CRP-like cAMP-binding protein
MTRKTDAQLALQPVVSWPRAMTAGRRHLVTVDLRLAAPASPWPFGEEALAFTCMLDGSDWCCVEAAGDARVLVHPTGGSTGPAEFVVTPSRAGGGRSLWLTIVTPRGLPVRTAELTVQVNAGHQAAAVAAAAGPDDVRARDAQPASQPMPGRTFWDALTAGERRALEGFAKERIFHAGTILCREGDQATPVFVLESGWVKVSLKLQGRERIVALRGAGDVVGELIGRETKARTATVTVLDQVRALVVGKDRFKAFLVENPGAAQVLERQDEERIAQTAAIGRLHGVGAERRLAGLLLDLARSRGGRAAGPPAITISISGEELANWLNARPDEVAVILDSWREHGIVQTGAHRLTVTDTGALERIHEDRPH